MMASREAQEAHLGVICDFRWIFLTFYSISQCFKFLSKYCKNPPKVLRMYCIDTGAIAFMFNGGSSCGSTIHPVDTKLCTEHCFLAPWVYLCSTSLNYAQMSLLGFSRHLTISLITVMCYIQCLMHSTFAKQHNLYNLLLNKGPV